MIIPKENYDVSEDMVTILYYEADGKIHAKRVFQSEYLENLTLDRIKNTGKKEYKDLIIITVIAENPLNGRLMRYDKHRDDWTLLGSLKGYA